MHTICCGCTRPCLNANNGALQAVDQLCRAVCFCCWLRFGCWLLCARGCHIRMIYRYHTTQLHYTLTIHIHHCIVLHTGDIAYCCPVVCAGWFVVYLDAEVLYALLSCSMYLIFILKVDCTAN